MFKTFISSQSSHATAPYKYNSTCSEMPAGIPIAQDLKERRILQLAISKLHFNFYLPFFWKRKWQQHSPILSLSRSSSLLTKKIELQKGQAPYGVDSLYTVLRSLLCTFVPSHSKTFNDNFARTLNTTIIIKQRQRQQRTNSSWCWLLLKNSTKLTGILTCWFFCHSDFLKHKKLLYFEWNFD